MKYPRCRADNPRGARFREDCRATPESACSARGQPVGADKKFCCSCEAPLSTQPTRFASPESYAPRYLAERINLTCRSALEGDRKRATVVFTDLKGSMLERRPP